VPRDVDGVEQDWSAASGPPLESEREGGEGPVQMPDIVPVGARKRRGEGAQVMQRAVVGDNDDVIQREPVPERGQIAQDGDKGWDQNRPNVVRPRVITWLRRRGARAGGHDLPVTG